MHPSHSSKSSSSTANNGDANVISSTVSVVEQTQEQLSSDTTGNFSTKISFNIAKKQTTQIVKLNKLANKHDDEDQQNDHEEEECQSRKRTILCMEDGVLINADEPKKKKKVYYIPVLQQSIQLQLEKLKKLVEDGNATEHDKARLALLLGCVGKEEDDEIQLMDGTKRIKLPESGITGMPTITVPDDTDPDYNSMPVGEFGLAFLRGCGWKNEKTAIGKTNPQAVPLRVTTSRPKGLGLGAVLPSNSPAPALQEDKKAKNGITQQKEESNSNTLAKNSYVKCLVGLNKNSYGKVTSMDEENSSVFVELAWPPNKLGKTIRVSQFAVEVISSAEYQAKMEAMRADKNERIQNSRN